MFYSRIIRYTIYDCFNHILSSGSEFSCQWTKSGVDVTSSGYAGCIWTKLGKLVTILNAHMHNYQSMMMLVVVAATIMIIIVPYLNVAQ